MSVAGRGREVVKALAEVGVHVAPAPAGHGEAKFTVPCPNCGASSATLLVQSGSFGEEVETWTECPKFCNGGTGTRRWDSPERLVAAYKRGTTGPQRTTTGTASATVPTHSYFEDVADLLAEAETEEPWLVEHVWHAGRVGFIAGEPKTFKSWLGLEMAVSVATGSKFLDTYETARPGVVLLVMEEDTRASLRRRLRRLTEAKGLPTDLPIRFLSRKGFRIDDAEWLERLRAEVERTRPVLVLLDPLACMHLGDENAAQDMSRVMRAIEEIRNDFGCAICIVHHNRKGGGVGASSRGGQKMRGSSVLHASSECALYVQRVGQRPVVKVDVELKDGGEAEPFSVLFEGDENTFTMRHAASATSAQAADTLDSIEEAIGELGDDAWVGSIAGKLDVSERTVRRYLGVLEETERIVGEDVPFGKTKRRMYRLAGDKVPAGLFGDN